MIQNLNYFPIESSKDWLNEKFCQFRKFVNDNNLTRVKILNNVGLQDDTQHSFPVKTSEDNFLPDAKEQLEKDFEFEELDQNIKIEKNMESSPL